MKIWLMICFFVLLCFWWFCFLRSLFFFFFFIGVFSFVFVVFFFTLSLWLKWWFILLIICFMIFFLEMWMEIVNVGFWVLLGFGISFRVEFVVEMLIGVGNDLLVWIMILFLEMWTGTCWGCFLASLSPSRSWHWFSCRICSWNADLITNDLLFCIDYDFAFGNVDGNC